MERRRRIRSVESHPSSPATPTVVFRTTGNTLPSSRSAGFRLHHRSDPVGSATGPAAEATADRRCPTAGGQSPAIPATAV